MIIEQNSRGRISIDKFEIKRLAVNYITENYTDFDCVDVVVNNPKIEITLRAKQDYYLNVLEDMRSDLVTMYKTKVHFDIKQLDISII